MTINLEMISAFTNLNYNDLMKKLIIFDCDGTLVDSEVLVCEIVPKIWSRYGVNFTTDEFKETFIGISEDSEVVQSTIKKLPQDIRQIVDKEVERRFQKSLKLVKGMNELLPTLGKDICVASNSPIDYVHKALQYTHIRQYFENRVYSAHQVKKGKPAPDLFFWVAKKQGVRPEDCLVVEDSAAGIRAAKAAGMQAVAFAAASHFTPRLKTKLKAEKPHFYFEHYSDLETFLRIF